LVEHTSQGCRGGATEWQSDAQIILPSDMAHLPTLTDACFGLGHTRGAPRPCPEETL